MGHGGGEERGGKRWNRKEMGKERRENDGNKKNVLGKNFKKRRGKAKGVERRNGEGGDRNPRLTTARGQQWEDRGDSCTVLTGLRSLCMVPRGLN